MSDNIIKLYDRYRNNALLITKIKTILNDFKRQDYQHGGQKFADLTKELGLLSEFTDYYNKENFNSGLYEIISALDNKDYSLCADSLNSFINNVMLPLQYYLFEDVSEYISDIYEDIYMRSDNKYVMEESATGYPSIRSAKASERYLCSVDDPMQEGMILAREIFNPQYDTYCIYGLGLGYHIYALDELTNHSADIYVYDIDPSLIDIASEGKLGAWQSVFKESRIHPISDVNLLQFSKAIRENDSKIFIHSPSLICFPEDNEQKRNAKDLLKKLQIKVSSYEHFKKDILINYYRNTKNVTTYAEELFPEFKDQNTVIIAAGPSLDKNLSELKIALEKNASLKTIAVGTVFKKLVSYGITPDAVCIMDPMPITIKQIEGLEKQNIKLILNTAVYYEIAETYSGPKYLACQSGFELTEKSGHILFDTGGSVTTLALDFAIRAKAKNIILMGCDMAFTNGCSHAKDTREFRNTNEEYTGSVKGYYGDAVKAGMLLILYREWIENRLIKDDLKNIGLFNATEGGAFIEGMEHISFKDTLERIL